MGCGSSVSRPAEAPERKGSVTKPTPQGSSTPPASTLATEPSPPSGSAPAVQQADTAGAAVQNSRPTSAARKPSSQLASASGRRAPEATSAATASVGDDDPQVDARRRAEELTRILARVKSRRAEEQGGEGGDGQQQQQRKKPPGSAGGSSGGLGAEVEALLGGIDHFPDLLKELLAAPTQILLPGGANPEDAAALQAVSGCSADQATRLLDCLAVVRAAADALPPDDDLTTAAGAAAAAAARPRSGSARSGADAAPAAAPAAPAATADGSKAATTTAAAAAAAAAAGDAAGSPGMTPSPQQLARSLGMLSGLVTDFPGLRTAAMARGAPESLLRILLKHTERAAAANAALAIASLAAGPPPHKTALIGAGAVAALIRAIQGDTAAAAAASGDAAVIAANACSALGNLVIGHAAGAAAVAAGGGVELLLRQVGVGNAANVRTNAAGVLVQLTAAHESYRAAIVAAGGVVALAAGMLRGPDAPACNAVTALYNLAAMTPPNLRVAMSVADGPLSVVPQLLLCMAGRNATGAADESVAAAASARVNASAVLLELCKDPAAAPLLVEERLGVPAALAALSAGRLPPPPPTAPADILDPGVELLYPVPPVVRGNCLMCLMAMARQGTEVQLELGRCGALGTLLELIAPGQEPGMQVNSANAICSLAAANADIMSALIAARCVPLMAQLLMSGGHAARANVCAVFVTMMPDPQARQQLQECGGLSSLVRMTAAVLDSRAVDVAGAEVEAAGAGGRGRPPVDPGGVLCNAVGTLAEASKYPDLRRALMQVEFGESLSTLLRCLQEKGTPEPAQVNAAAALCHLCREQPAAVQLSRLKGVEVLKDLVTRGEAAVEAGSAVGPGIPSARLLHNATRALHRLQEQLAEAEEAAAAAAAARTAQRGSDGRQQPRPASAASASAAAAGAASPEGDELYAVEPRTVWDSAGSASASRGARNPPARGMSQASNSNDVDDVSTVIRPPLPLAAF